MITPSQIRERKITTVESGGYDRNEVNELLVEVIESYESVYKENKELYRKMEILANRIEEYRMDEDSIKTTLITAQKMADRVTAESKEKAEKVISDSTAAAQRTVVDAKEKADKIIGEARDYVATLTKEKEHAAEEIINDAKEKSNEAINSAKFVAMDILDKAKALSEELVEKAKEEKICQQEISAKLRAEAKEFKSALVSLYEGQLDKLKDAADLIEEDNSENLEAVEGELDTVLSNVKNMTDELAQVAKSAQAETEAPEDENAEPVDTEEEITEEQTDESDDFDIDDEVDEIIESIEENAFSSEEEEQEEMPTVEEVEVALDAFTRDEITPIDENSASAIPVIEDEPEFESDAMPFEDYFNVKKETVRTNETISLIPPEDDEEEDENPKFKGFFKKKK